jgi:hypothetical protein
MLLHCALIAPRNHLKSGHPNVKLFAVHYTEVSFHTPHRQVKKGIIQRMHKKTASIKTDDGHIWNVYPVFLKKES